MPSAGHHFGFVRAGFWELRSGFFEEVPVNRLLGFLPNHSSKKLFDCLCCRNFAEQRQTIYPDEFKTLLGCLGADPIKEWEAYELGPCTTKPNLRPYGG